MFPALAGFPPPTSNHDSPQQSQCHAKPGAEAVVRVSSSGAASTGAQHGVVGLQIAHHGTEGSRETGWGKAGAGS